MAPRIDHYDWAGGRETLLGFGPTTGPVLIAALPLFEEANRTRTFTVTLLRALERRGIAGMLPDVPGQGESTMPIAGLTIASMAIALGALADRCRKAGRRTYALGIRSGALLDSHAAHRGRWHLAPQTGADLLRDQHRIWRAAGHGGDVDAMLSGEGDPVEIAGNLLPVALLASLAAATPVYPPGDPRRIVRLVSDPRDADRKIDAAPLWRRSEPGNDPVLVEALADDIATWLVACEG